MLITALSMQAQPIAAPKTAPLAAAITNTPVANPDTETVIDRFQVKPGKEADFLKVLQTHWPTLRRLNMVLETPHVVLRGEDDEHKTYFIEVLTWKDHDTPDHAPPEVLAIWKEMEALCERRLGHRGIEFHEVQVVPAAVR
jgi:quinol monooxygenase YgiN